MQKAERATTGYPMYIWVEAVEGARSKEIMMKTKQVGQATILVGPLMSLTWRRRFNPWLRRCRRR